MLLESTARGLYCRAGEFYIDPWQPVDSVAILTHAHSDHARWGSVGYLVAEPGLEIARIRLGNSAQIQTLAYGESVCRNGVKVSLHPAGHILGSAQVRVEHRGEVWVVSGDYKTQSDSTCDPFEPVRCHVFVTESTFGLPIFRWRPQQEVFFEINQWWRDAQTKGRTAVLFSYALGKAQRLLAGIDSTIGPILAHGAVAKFLPAYERAGVKLPDCLPTDSDQAQQSRGKALVIAPPSADHSGWLKKFGECETAFASGWMQIRGIRRRRGVDRGFVVSDHADWPGLLQSIEATEAETIQVTHGYTEALARWLKEKGWQAETMPTHFQAESADESEGLQRSGEP